jgi:hypothetical protein
MAKYHVQHFRTQEEGGRSRHCFRVHPKDEPERWAIQTNPHFDYGYQRRLARIAAKALSDEM